jgi:hypothetical protein
MHYWGPLWVRRVQLPKEGCMYISVGAAILILILLIIFVF